MRIATDFVKKHLKLPVYKICWTWISHEIYCTWRRSVYINSIATITIRTRDHCMAVLNWWLTFLAKTSDMLVVHDTHDFTTWRPCIHPFSSQSSRNTVDGIKNRRQGEFRWLTNEINQCNNKIEKHGTVINKIHDSCRTLNGICITWTMTMMEVLF